ncbi:MAG: EAL domain-containing protein, partial [Spongiibacteraceae bacterium]
MARQSTIRLLLINESDNEGERLISLFRNAGRVARAHRVISAEDLHTQLEKDRWDLLIANDKHPEIVVDQCLQQLKKLKTHLPSLIIRDDNIEAALNAGASDVVASNDDQRLIFAAFRELQHLKKSRQLAATEAKLTDAEERCNLLMAQSQDAIAYVADGMLVSCNPLFCTQFGYAEPEDLDCAPVIDLIDSADHTEFKHLLKALTQQGGDDSSNFNFTGKTQDHESFPATMQLSNAVFDDEPCIQITIKARETKNSTSSAVESHQDSASGLYSHEYFLSQLDRAAKQASAGTHIATLLFIGIDQFNSIRTRFGISHSYKILRNITEVIQHQSNEAHTLTHFCDDGFTMLLQNIGTEKAQLFATELCKTLEKYIIEIAGQSVQCTASIGLLPIDGSQPEDPSKLIDSAFSACEEVRTQANKDGIGNGVMVFVATREKKSLGDASDDAGLDSFLEEAIADEQFFLTFQPIVSLRGSRGDHYEVRTLMLDDDGNTVTADQFLSKINFKGVNTRLDRWVLLEATKKLAHKIEAGQNTRLFINLTANTLQDESLIPWLSVALKAGGIPPAALIFQFNEADLANVLKPAKAFAASIKELGCKISIAGFGQSDTPFKTLKQIPA